MVIGHEITHGFDDEGRQYDKNGNRVPWWSNTTINQFNQRKQCIIEQYSNYTVAQIHKNVCSLLLITRNSYQMLFLVEWSTDTRRKYC